MASINTPGPVAIVLLLGFGVLFILIGPLKIMVEQRHYAQWPKTEATLVRYETGKISAGGRLLDGHWRVYLVEQSGALRERRGPHIRPPADSPVPPPATKVEVAVDPNHSEYVMSTYDMAETPGTAGFYWLGGLLLLFAFGGLAQRMHARP